MRLPLAATLIAAGALAGPAQAAPVLELGPHGASLRDDPHLPPRAETDLPPPGRAAATTSARRGRVAARTTVRQALNRAFRAGEITREQRAEWLADWTDAYRLQRRLSGARRAQLRAIVRGVQQLAGSEQLTASRMAAVFLLARRNAEYWRVGPYPASGQRIQFDGSELVFQYYPGHGLQIQPLANFGKANGLWRSGRKVRLRTLLDELVAIASRRAGFTTWEYWFRFGGGTPPWISAMAQGTAVQALARGSELLEDDSYLRVARQGIRAFWVRAPAGVRAGGRAGGSHYLLYSFARGLRVLNGFAQALNGLHEYAVIAGERRAMRLFERGDKSLRAELPAYDTRAWSLYSLGGAEATLEYHQLSRQFLGRLCEQVGPGPHCWRAGRFERYVTQAPRLRLVTSRLKAGNLQNVRFRLSKSSTVRIAISRGGRVVRWATQWAGYGMRSFSWRPPRRGRYRVELSAQSFAGTSGSASGTIAVRPRG